MREPKPNPRKEYRMKQREHIDASPTLAQAFPTLKALKAVLEFFDATGTTKNREMKCKLNVEHASSALWFACPAAECLRGDFDLTEALAKAVAERRKLASGEFRCAGTRKLGNGNVVPCETLLRYRLALSYN